MTLDFILGYSQLNYGWTGALRQHKNSQLSNEPAAAWGYSESIAPATDLSDNNKCGRIFQTINSLTQSYFPLSLSLPPPRSITYHYLSMHPFSAPSSQSNITSNNKIMPHRVDLSFHHRREWHCLLFREGHNREGWVFTHWEQLHFLHKVISAESFLVGNAQIDAKLPFTSDLNVLNSRVKSPWLQTLSNKSFQPITTSNSTAIILR